MRDDFREKRLRRAARDAGLQLVRSFRWRLVGSEHSYALIDPVRGTLVLADEKSGYGMTLDAIERYLREIEGLETAQTIN